MLQIAEIDQSETVEVNIRNNNLVEYKFGDNETTLDKIVLMGLTVHSAVLSKGPRTGATMLPDNDLKKGYITLSNSANKHSINRLPIETLINADARITYLKPRLVDVRKSFITLPGSGALVLPGDNLGYAIAVTFYYEKFDAVKHAHLLADDK